MFGRKKEDKSIDYPRLNEVIKLTRDILKIVLILIVFVLIVLGSYILREWKIFDIIGTILGIISPFFIGIVIAWLFDPIVTFISKRGLNRLLSTAIVFVLFIALVAVGGTLIAPSLGEQINEIITTAPSVIDNLTGFFNNFINNLSNVYGYDFDIVRANVIEIFNNLVLSITVDLPTMLINIVKAIINGGINFIFGLFIAFYLLLDFRNVRKHLLTFVPKRLHDEIIGLTDRLNSMLRNYVQGTLIIMFLLFICQSVGFTLAGLRAPLVFGLFCAITNIIPYFGPYIGGIPAIIVGFTMDPLIGVFCLVSVITCQFLESYFLNPVVMSKTMKLHPVTIMIGLLIFGHFFGILGMILSTPVISCAKVVILYLNEKYQLLNMINEENDNIEIKE
ncbi:MAG: AI-2E family transporter [Bacilli bacterium]|nr:AI-2E family transporter [Bacilli bacterium]